MGKSIYPSLKKNLSNIESALGEICGDRDKQQKTLVILDVNVLRANDLAISKHISWERSAQDYLRELYTDKTMQRLKNLHHIIVRFGVSGAIYSYKIGERDYHRLYFDPFPPEDRGNNDRGEVFGYNSIFATSIIDKILAYQQLVQTKQPNSEFHHHKLAEEIGDGIKTALKRCQYHFNTGFNISKIKEKKNSPNSWDYFKEVLFPLKNQEDGTNKIASERIPIAYPGWIILNQSAEYNLLKVGMDLVFRDNKEVLNNPHIKPTIWSPLQTYKEGNSDKQPGLTVIDRRELENYRVVQRLMKEAFDTPISKPLSIGIFGPPGSGKSFLIGELAKSVLPESVIKWKEHENKSNKNSCSLFLKYDVSQWNFDNFQLVFQEIFLEHRRLRMSYEAWLEAENKGNLDEDGFPLFVFF